VKREIFIACRDGLTVVENPNADPMFELATVTGS